MPAGELGLTTQTGCNVRAWATHWDGENAPASGVYLALAVDTRRAELKMTSEEARQIAANLIAQADNLDTLMGAGRLAEYGRLINSGMSQAEAQEEVWPGGEK